MIEYDEYEEMQRALTMTPEDRKTIRYPDGAVELNCSINDAVMQLAEYEDNYLTPEGVREVMTEWHNWKQAEAEDRLIILPCKVGTEVWSAVPFTDNVPRKGYIVAFLTDEQSVYSFYVKFEAVGAEFLVNNIGETIFFTQEEAEMVSKKEGITTLWR